MTSQSEIRLQLQEKRAELAAHKESVERLESDVANLAKSLRNAIVGYDCPPLEGDGVYLVDFYDYELALPCRGVAFPEHHGPSADYRALTIDQGILNSGLGKVRELNVADLDFSWLVQYANPLRVTVVPLALLASCGETAEKVIEWLNENGLTVDAAALADAAGLTTSDTE